MMKYAAIAVLFASASACAATADRGFYVGADVAGLDARVAERYGLLFGTPEFFFRARPDSATAQGVDDSWGAQFGYRINRHLAVELAYTDLGTMAVHETYDLAPLIPVIAERAVSFSAAGPSLSWLGRIPAGARFEAFVRVGVLHAQQELHRSFGSPPRPNTEDDVSLFGIGAAYDLSDAWTIRLEYQRIGELAGRGVIGDPGSVGPIRIERYSFGLAFVF